MKVKQALDQLFADVEFDTQLYNKILINNTEYISRNQEHTRLFSGRNIGCYHTKYTYYDKSEFYSSVFEMELDDVLDVVEGITSIPKSFKIARDDISLVCFYIAHRFMSNKDLADNIRVEYAKEILNYFSYRTLVQLSSDYFVYPISESKATSLTERLSGKYIIKQVKNWKEYCQYRSQEYLDGKYKPLLVTFKDDHEIPNAISDLFNRTKDALKNIYGEFMDMLQADEITASKKALMTDADGADTIADRIENVQKYLTRVDEMLTDRNSLIKPGHIAIVTDILKGLSYDMMQEALDHLLNYCMLGRDSYNKVNKFFKDILVNAVEYLQKNELTLSGKADVIAIMNSLVGNVLYARGTSVSLNVIKTDGDHLVRASYKSAKDDITDRNISSVRNGLYLYIVLMALVE